MASENRHCDRRARTSDQGGDTHGPRENKIPVSRKGFPTPMTPVITPFIVEREPLEPVEPDQMPFDPILRAAKNGEEAENVKKYFSIIVTRE